MQNNLVFFQIIYQSDMEMRHEHYNVCSENINHGKSSVHSLNFQYDSIARYGRNPNCSNINNVFSNYWYAFVSGKSLFTFANIQCIFTCFIYIISLGNLFKVSIAINLLITFFHIFRDSVLKSKHIIIIVYGGGGEIMY